MTLTFNKVAGAFFLVFALVHVYRLIAPFPVLIGSTLVPESASYVGALLGGAMAYWGFRSKR